MRSLPVCTRRQFLRTASCGFGSVALAGLLSERRDGTRRLYRARRDRIQQLRADLDGFWTDRLGALKTAAEREAKRKRS